MIRLVSLKVNVVSFSRKRTHVLPKRSERKRSAANAWRACAHTHMHASYFFTFDVHEHAHIILIHFYVHEHAHAHAHARTLTNLSALTAHQPALGITVAEVVDNFS